MNKWILLILSLLLLSACEKDEPVPDVHVSERTVLVWLAGTITFLIFACVNEKNYICTA